MDTQLQRVFVASGEVEAQQVRGFLEAAGIATAERGEALRKTHGLTVDGLGAVDILVDANDAERARALLNSADAGLFRLGENEELSNDSNDPNDSNDSNDSNDPNGSNDPNDPNVI